MSDELELLKRRLERERKARLAAEKTLEDKSFELYQTNEALREANASLEERVAARTEDLRETESRFRLIVETASDIIYRTDPRGFFTYANPTTLKKMGYSLEELQILHFTDLVAFNYRQELLDFYLEQIRIKKSETYKEFPAIRKNGETIWIGQNVIFVYNDDGSLKQVNAVARDITDSKISQTRLQNLITTLQSGILLEDENRKIALVNQNFCHMFGIPNSPEELVGVDCSSSAEQSKGLFVQPDTFVRRIQNILEDKETVLKDELHLKDGRVFERDYIPIFIDNHYSGHLWNYHDVSTQRTYVNAIQRSEEKYRSIIENMNLGLLEVDLEERILYANQSFCEMSGYDRDEIIGKNASRLFVRGDNAGVLKEKNALRTGGVSDAYQIATKNKRGEAKWWLVSGAPLFNAQNELTGSIGIHLDITKQKELEKELVKAKFEAEESASAKEVFLANMSHEIRTPMNGIIGMARQLAKSELNAQQQFYLDTIHTAADNLLVILNDILDLSKIEAGKLSIESVSFDFESTLQQACTVIMPKAEEKGLELRLDISPAINGSLNGDPFRLNQLILNLVGNAIKFTEKGKVEVKCCLLEQKGKEWLIGIQIKDNGVGMDEDYLAFIFEKFTQEDRSIARKYGGTGLGMNISKQLVELMNGSINIQSKKNQGTLVELRIPFLREEKKTNEEELIKEEIDYSLLKDKRLLIAEDNELNRLVMESTLAHYELEMDFVVNGKEVIEHLEKEQPDLILMDIQMPVMDGMEATQYLRKELKLNIPVIALTANVMKEDRERYLSAGLNDMLSKPFEEEQLLRMLLNWLGEANSPDLAQEQAVADERLVLYSLDKLEQVSRGNQEFVNRMIQVFCEQADAAIDEIMAASKVQNLEAIRRMAHKMKPSIDNLAINRLKEPVRSLEKVEGVEEMEQLSQLFCQHMSEVVVALQLYLDHKH